MLAHLWSTGNAHIPQARYFDQLECTQPTKLIPRGVPEIKCFESYLSRLGVSNNDHIVLYDRSPMGFYASSRAWWLLKTYGMNSLSILNGGFYKWLKEINKMESSDNNNNRSKTEESEKFTVHLNKDLLKNYDDILNIVSTNSKEPQIVDARSANLFHGLVSFFCDYKTLFHSLFLGANAGHMPNALNVPYTDVFDPTNHCFKSNDELKKVFNNAGVDLSKPSIYTCQTGTTASTLAFAAHILGQKSLSVYNGSFTEWQQRAPQEFIIHDQTVKPAA
ncbi:unnamed protein product [Rotaria sp. Silwood2]|nr:unnamed protein product [Rotaria sp. Silwood2]